MDEAIAHGRARTGYDHILVGYADCGTGGMAGQSCGEKHVRGALLCVGAKGPRAAICLRILPRGSAVSSGNWPMGDTFDGLPTMTRTFLCRHFNALLYSPAGPRDRHPRTLRPIIFGNLREGVVYLAQTRMIFGTRQGGGRCGCHARPCL